MELPSAVRAIVDASIDPAALVDRELRVVHFNRAYLQLTGFKLRELSGQPLRAMCHNHFELDACQGGCVAERAFQAHKAIRVDQVQGKGGLRLNVTAVPLAEGSGPAELVLETYRDVTAESRMQDEYRELLARARRQNEILQEEVQRRTEDLSRSLDELRATRMQLVQSEKMSSLGVLVAGIAHELNNPISFIVGNLDFVEEDVRGMLQALDAEMSLELPSGLRATMKGLRETASLDRVRSELPLLLETMREGARRVDRIVRDLRVYSHGGADAHEQYNLNEGIDLTLRIAGPQAKGRVALRSALGKVEPLQCHGTQINQVIMNLVTNAIQAIQGEGTIWVRSGDAGDHIWFEVEDDGPGIAPGVLDKIFDPFFTTKKVGEGTGLGLSISQRIVVAHGGTIEVASEVGRGTRFRVRLPRRGSRPRSEGSLTAAQG